MTDFQESNPRVKLPAVVLIKDAAKLGTWSGKTPKGREGGREVEMKGGK